MNDDILAGSTKDLRFDKDGHFVHVSDCPTGPTFTVQMLDYWQAREVMAIADPVAQIRRTVELGLVAIDGDADKAKTFLARPKAKLINPLNDAITDYFLGN